MKYMNISERAAVTNMYKIFVLALLAMSFSFSTAEAGTKKKQLVGAKTVAKINKSKVTRVPANKNQKVPAGVPTKLPEKSQASAASRAVGSLRAPASVSDSDKSLEIRGQSRNLSMLLVLKNRHENIDFVKPRETYREEITKTDF